MNLEMDGVCTYCESATPVSPNTRQDEGIVCASCRRTRGSWEAVRREQMKRLAEIAEERERLLQSLRGRPGLN